MNLLLVNNQYQMGGAETVVQQLWSRVPNARLLIPEAPLRRTVRKRSVPALPLFSRENPGQSGDASPTTPNRPGLPGCPRDGRRQSGDASHTALNVEVMYPRLFSRLHHSRFQNLVEKCFPMFAWTNRHFAQLRNDRADIIHIHNFHGMYASIEALANLARAKRVIWTFHGLWGVTGGCDKPKDCRRYLERCGNCPQLGLWPIGDIDRTGEELSRKLIGLADLPLEVIAPSKYYVEVLQKSEIGRGWTVHHIPNGIDATKFRPAQGGSDRLRILVVNRNFQDPHKGFPMVRGALNTVDPQGVELTLVGLNSGWAVEQLQRGFQTRDLGYVTDRETLARLYAESDIFLFASAEENFPCVIVEAMASGCCVVATPCSGVVEQITDGQTGFLGSAISGEALAEALGRALNSRADLRELGLRARREVIEKFSEDQMIESHQRVYGRKLSVSVASCQ